MKDIERLLIEEGIVFDDELSGIFGIKSIKRQDLAKFLAEKYSPVTVDLVRTGCEKQAAFLIPYERAIELSAIALAKKGEVVVVALPRIEPEAVAQLREITGRKVKVVLATEEQISRLIDAFYNRGETTIKELEKRERSEIEYDDKRDDADPFPLIVHGEDVTALPAIPVEPDHVLAGRVRLQTEMTEWEMQFIGNKSLDPIKL